MEAGDLAIQAHMVYSSDEDEASEDGISIAASETSSASSTGKQNLLDEVISCWDFYTTNTSKHNIFNVNKRLCSIGNNNN